MNSTIAEKPRINLPQYGRYCPIEEWQQIIWLWNNDLKRTSNTACAHFYKNMLFHYEQLLLDCEAYELLNHIHAKIKLHETYTRTNTILPR